MITKEQIQEYYNVLEDGTTYSLRRNLYSPMRGKIDRYGYPVQCLRIEGKNRHIPVHRLVAICHIENTDKLPCINHKDGNKLNNNKINLEWCTNQYNVQHAYDTGLSVAWNKGKKGVYTEENLKAMRFNQPNRKPVRVERNGTEVARYDSLGELCREMGFDDRTAMRVLKGKKNYNTIKGCKLYYS